MLVPSIIVSCSVGIVFRNVNIVFHNAFGGKFQAKVTAGIDPAVNGQFSLVAHRHMLGNGQAQAGAAGGARPATVDPVETRSEEHTSELPSLMRISDAVFCLKKKN